MDSNNKGSLVIIILVHRGSTVACPHSILTPGHSWWGTFWDSFYGKGKECMAKCALTFKASTLKCHTSRPPIFHWPEHVNYPCLSSTGQGKTVLLCARVGREKQVLMSSYFYLTNTTPSIRKWAPWEHRRREGCTLFTAVSQHLEKHVAHSTHSINNISWRLEWIQP